MASPGYVAQPPAQTPRSSRQVYIAFAKTTQADSVIVSNGLAEMFLQIKLNSKPNQPVAVDILLNGEVVYNLILNDLAFREVHLVGVKLKDGVNVLLARTESGQESAELRFTVQAPKKAEPVTLQVQGQKAWNGSTALCITLASGSKLAPGKVRLHTDRAIKLTTESVNNQKQKIDLLPGQAFEFAVTEDGLYVSVELTDPSVHEGVLFVSYGTKTERRKIVR